MILPVLTVLDTDDLVEQLTSYLTYQELLDLIADIDSAVCDWGFSEDIYAWAKDQHKEYKAEVKEYGN